MSNLNSVVSSIADKKSQQMQLLDSLQKREALLSFLHDNGIFIDKDSRFTCGPIECAGKLIAVRVNGEEHRLDCNMTIKEWFDRFSIKDI